MAHIHCSTDEKRLVKADGRIIGSLEDNKFIKSVIGSKHRLRHPPAWVIDSSASEIVVIDKETDTKYYASVETFDQLKRELDRGFGRQYFLTLNHWRAEENNNGHRQLSLWGEQE